LLCKRRAKNGGGDRSAPCAVGADIASHTFGCVRSLLSLIEPPFGGFDGGGLDRSAPCGVGADIESHTLGCVRLPFSPIEPPLGGSMGAVGIVSSPSDGGMIVPFVSWRPFRLSSGCARGQSVVFGHIRRAKTTPLFPYHQASGLVIFSWFCITKLQAW